jgi:hypothetical protein
MNFRLGLRELMEPMAWLLRLLSILAAAITSLFVARDALNFGIIETLLMITLVVAVAVIAVAWKIRRES